MDPTIATVFTPTMTCGSARKLIHESSQGCCSDVDTFHRVSVESLGQPSIHWLHPTDLHNDQMSKCSTGATKILFLKQATYIVPSCCLNVMSNSFGGVPKVSALHNKLMVLRARLNERDNMNHLLPGCCYCRRQKSAPIESANP